MQAAATLCHIREQGRQEQQEQHARRLYADVVGQTSGGGGGGNGDGWAAAPARRRPSSAGSSLSHGGGVVGSDDAFSNGRADSWQDDRPDGPLARDQAAAAAAAARGGVAAAPKSCLLPRGGGGGVYQRSGGGGSAGAAAAQREASAAAVVSHAAGPVVPKLHGLPQALRGDDPAAGHAPTLRSARHVSRGGSGVGPIGQLHEEVEALRKRLERKEEMLLEAQVTSSRLHGDNWKALQAHNDMAQELEATSAAEMTARSRLAAVVSMGRQLSRTSASHASAAEAPLAAVHSAMREYHGVLMAMEEAMGRGDSRCGTPGPPGTPGDEAVASQAVAAELASPDVGVGPAAQRAYLQQQIDLRDHIVTNLAAHLGSLEVCIRRGGTETSELATKLVMLAGGTLDE